MPAVGMGRALAHRWAAPLAICGLLVLGLSTLGTVYDARAGLWTAVAYAVLLATFAVVWQGQLEAWGSLIFVGLAFQQGLRLAGVPVMDQPPRWAVLALFLTLLAYLSHAPRFAALSVWRGPLFTGSIAIGVAAVVAALGVQLVMLSRTAFPTLSATAAVTGLTLLAHSYARRTRLLAYLGVALLEVGYMLQLVLFDVGQPQAFVLPAGVYLLAIAYLEWRRGTDPRLKATLETGALVLLLGVSLIQAVGFLGAGYDRYVYDTFLLFESLAVFGVGAALRWKKPFFAGSLALVVDVLILLSDPLRAMNTWYLMGIVGISIIGMAVLVEKRRQQIPVWVDQWRQRLEAWD